MTTKHIGEKFVELCSAGKFEDATRSFYSGDIVSIEAAAPPGQPAEVRGLDACLKKGAQWNAAHEVHSARVDGPYPHGDERFAVVFDFDITRRADNQRLHMKEVAVYTVRNDKIVREEFYYSV